MNIELIFSSLSYQGEHLYVKAQKQKLYVVVSKTNFMYHLMLFEIKFSLSLVCRHFITFSEETLELLII